MFLIPQLFELFLDLFNLLPRMNVVLDFPILLLKRLTRPTRLEVGLLLRYNVGLNLLISLRYHVVVWISMHVQGGER